MVLGGRREYQQFQGAAHIINANYVVSIMPEEFWTLLLKDI
jgi:hypothetical protein